MVLWFKLRPACVVTLVFALLCIPAHALIALNDGTDHIYLTGTASIGYDSNIFAHNGGDGDTIYSASVLAEYHRRAGLIAVDGSAEVDFSRFNNYTGESFNNPKFLAAFTKNTGPTTGKFALGAARESQADAVAGVRTDSWVYDADLNMTHPVIERYSISGHLGFSDRLYGANTVELSDLQTYTAGADLLYALNTQRSFLAGYQFRRSETSSRSTYNDHSFTAGIEGRIISKLRGSLRAGYEVRNPTGSTADGAYRGLTAAGAVSWAASSRLTITGELSKDVSVTANDLSVDTTSAGLTMGYVINDRLTFTGNVGAGKNRYLGASAAGRRDDYVTWGAGLKSKLLEHLDASLVYAYDDNHSTLNFSDFTRNTLTFSLSSRW
ncbi:MAG: outer membrane beta-barrel protein [Opitutaceae bacterium]